MVSHTLTPLTSQMNVKHMTIKSTIPRPSTRLTMPVLKESSRELSMIKASTQLAELSWRTTWSSWLKIALLWQVWRLKIRLMLSSLTNRSELRPLDYGTSLKQLYWKFVKSTIRILTNRIPNTSTLTFSSASLPSSQRSLPSTTSAKKSLWRSSFARTKRLSWTSTSP